MLVLSRRPQQSIMIGDSVVVTVLEVKGDQVRLGITAPRDVTVHREEVLVSIARQEAAASCGEPQPAVPVQRVAAAVPPPRRSSTGPAVRHAEAVRRAPSAP